MWKSEVYLVVEIPDPNNPTVVVERADGSGDRRAIHFTECRPCPQNVPSPVPSEPTAQEGSDSTEVPLSESSGSESEDIIVFCNAEGHDRPLEPTQPQARMLADPTTGQLRRSSRSSKGKHPNLHRLPRSAIGAENHSTEAKVENTHPPTTVSSYKGTVLELTSRLMQEAGKLLQEQHWTK